jgi:hypothetical protein
MGHTEVMLSSGIFSIRLEGVFCKKNSLTSLYEKVDNFNKIWLDPSLNFF